MRSLARCPEPLEFTTAKQKHLSDYGPASGHSESGRWEDFKSAYPDGYKAARTSLYGNQYGLCAFCETDMSTDDQQIEHFRPKHLTTAACDLTMDFFNYLLCCKGGTKQKGRLNHSCGEAKGDIDPLAACILNPYDLPLFPIFKVAATRPDYGDSDRPGLDGLYFKADDDACQRAQLNLNHVKATIKNFNLNCDRLARSRNEIWTSLDEDVITQTAGLSGRTKDDALKRLALWYLSPKGGKLHKYHTMIILYFASYFPDFLTETAWQQGNPCPVL